MVVVVLGCHRAGTSLGASVLEALGVNMGQRFSPANAINPYGYYEDLDFYELNTRILKHAGGSWHHPPSECRLLADALPVFGEEIEELLEHKHSRSQRWGWKDPRTALTFPLYMHYLDIARDDVVAVRMIRARAAICHSLGKWYRHLRVGWSGLVAYYESCIGAHEALLGPQRVYRMQFEELTTKSKAERVVIGLAGFLGVDLERVGAALNRIHFRRW